MLSFGVNGLCDLIFSPCFNCCSSNSIFIGQQFVENVQYSLIPSNKVCWKDANLIFSVITQINLISRNISLMSRNIW